MHAEQIDKDGPVTVVVTRIAKRDKIREFEEWMDGIIHEAMRFEGHMGVNVIRPSDISNPEYVIIFRFNTFENLARWENSEARREWLAKSKELAEGEPVVEKQTGLEIWFTPRSRSGGSIKGNNKASSPSSSTTASAAPPRYKMAVIITAVIFILVSVLLPQIRQLTTGLHIHLSTFIGVVIMVLLMTYVIMPFLTRLLGPWLSKKRLF
jgi:antibiotic biosynthesis monooxygenase (ABM) superfamily enzyme